MDVFNDRYRIIAPLGEGGAGATWRALDTRTGSEVTVKKLNIALNATNEAMLERETRLLGQLDHPQIPRFVEAFVEDFRMRRYLHLVLDFVPGEPLSVAMQRRRFKQDEVREVLADLLGVVAWLHRLAPPVIHRDIKPSNLILRPDGRIAIIDFGLATDAVDRTFLHTMAVGTLGYQAPEQIAGDPCPASDVYSVGVVALELLTRASPRALLSGQTLRWHGRAAHLDARWKRWLERALAPDPEDRFADGGEALAALRDTGAPATPAPPSPRPAEPARSPVPVQASAAQRPRSPAPPRQPRTAPESYVPGGHQAFEHFFDGQSSPAPRRSAGPGKPASAFSILVVSGFVLISAIAVGPLLYALNVDDGPAEVVEASSATPRGAASGSLLTGAAACRAGDHDACRATARELREPDVDGRISASGDTLARSLLATGCLGGDAASCADLAEIHGETPEGAEWADRACALGACESAIRPTAP